MNGNVIKKSITSRPTSARDNSGHINVVAPKALKKCDEYPSCHHHGNFVLDRNGLSPSLHLLILSQPKVCLLNKMHEELYTSFYFF